MHAFLSLLSSLVLAIVSPAADAEAPVPTAPAPVFSSFVPETLATGFATDRSPFSLTFGDQLVPYATMGVFALPGETTAIEIAAPGPFTLAASAGDVETTGDGRWNWVAPAEPGLAVLEVVRADGVTMTLHAFVMVPYAEMKSGKIRGYSVGSYPEPRAQHAERDAKPRGFIEVDERTANFQVSPHFRLGQFVCKAGAGFPKYVVVQPKLLLRLENLLETVNRRGVPAQSFTVMSAYRTPSYNKGIGNATTFTRHQYGDAADIYVDELPADGAMDDINRDGRFDRKDAVTLHQWAEETEGVQPEGIAGGLSAYSANAAHGPFVHVDTRGYRARW
jgi:hypothetical protein